jgi:hypothetical protein
LTWDGVELFANTVETRGLAVSDGRNAPNGSLILATSSTAAETLIYNFYANRSFNILTTATSPITFRNASSGTGDMVRMLPGGSVEIYFNGSKKLETTSTGISATGNVNATGNVKATAGQLQVSNSAQPSFVTGFQAPLAFTQSVVYRLPPADGSFGQVLSTNGSGDLSWRTAGGGSVGTLQTVTDNGATTTNTIRLFDSVTSFEAITLDPQSGLISIFPQALGDSGLYLSPNGAQFGTSTGSFSSAGPFPCAVKLNGSAGASLQTAQAAFPVQLWAGGTNLIGSPQVSVTGTATSINNQLQFSNSTQTAAWAFIQATPTSLNLGIAPNTTVLNLTTATTTIANNLQMAGYIQVNSPNGIRFYESSAVDYVGLIAPSSLGASYNLTLPPADGAGGQVLSTNGSGTLGWITTAKVVATPGSSGAGGNDNEISFDAAGNFYFFRGGSWWKVAGSSF